MDASVRARLERLARIMDPYRDTPRRIPATAVRDDAPSPDSPPSPGEGDDVRWYVISHSVHFVYLLFLTPVLECVQAFSHLEFVSSEYVGVRLLSVALLSLKL